MKNDNVHNVRKIWIKIILFILFFFQITRNTNPTPCLWFWESILRSRKKNRNQFLLIKDMLDVINSDKLDEDMCLVKTKERM